VTEWQAKFDKKALGKTFRSTAKAIEETVTSQDQEDLSDLAEQLEQKGSISVALSGQDPVSLDKSVVQIEKTTRIENIREYVPNVIEPSFGIGRILYSLLEHVYWHRPNDVARAVSLLPIFDPTHIILSKY
jgi:glycyl-tRNA synthetase